MNIEIVMQEEHPNRRLNPSDSYGRDSFSSQSTSMQGEESFLPKGNKLFGCMFIFFLFSGGFIGSFFALDALEEPEPNSFNAQLGVYPGACVDDESGCNKVRFGLREGRGVPRDLTLPDSSSIFPENK